MILSATISVISTRSNAKFRFDGRILTESTRTEKHETELEVEGMESSLYVLFCQVRIQH